MCKKGKAQFSVSLVDNAERKEEGTTQTKPFQELEWEIKETIVAPGFCDDTQDLLQTAYRQKTWSSPLSNIKRAERLPKILSEAHLEKSEKKTKRSRVEVAQTTVRLFVVGVVQGHEGKKMERLHAARLYWATLQCI